MRLAELFREPEKSGSGGFLVKYSTNCGHSLSYNVTIQECVRIGTSEGYQLFFFFISILILDVILRKIEIASRRLLQESVTRLQA
jgi:hypothetical protein